MYELAFKPYDIFFDLDSISPKISYLEMRQLLDDLLNNGYRFAIFGDVSNFSYNNPNQNYIVSEDFNFHDIDEYEKLFHLGDHEQYKSLVVTSDPETIKVATSFGISCIFLVKNYEDDSTLPFLKVFPDYMLTLKDLRGLLVGNEGGTKLFFETIFEKQEYYISPTYQNELEYYYDKNQKLDVILVGRYFRSNDPRSYSHKLTKLILAFKDEKEGAYAALKPVFRDLIIDIENDFDFITIVPCKPSKNNRFTPLFYNNGNPISSKVNLNLLSCPNDYDSQKKYGTRQEKAQNVRDVFKYTNSVNIKDKKILIIDDILTTGSTALECARVLYEAGARKVILLPLGVTQDTFETMAQLAPIGDGDGNIYKLRFKKSNGEPFWVSGDRNFKNYEIIKEEYLKQNDIETFVYKDLME